MKKYAPAIFIGIIGICTSCTGNKLKTIELSESDSTKTIEAVTGQEVILRLRENPSTGYAWTLKSAAPDIMQLMDDDFKIPARNKNRDGAGGTHTYHYKLLKAGTAELTMIYSFPGRNEPKFSQRYTVTLHVK